MSQFHAVARVSEIPVGRFRAALIGEKKIVVYHIAKGFFASDETSPSLPLRGLPRPREIFDALKARVIAIKRTRGVIKMDA